MSNLVAEVEQARTWLNNKMERRRLLEENTKRIEGKVEDVNVLMENLIKARWAITEVVRRTQKQFKRFVENLISKLLSVYDRDFKFILDFSIKNNRTFIQPLIQDGAHEPQVPKDDMGCGVLDLVSFAFRVVLRGLERPRSSPVFLLDEPFRHLKGRLLDRAGDAVRSIARRLDLQLIIVTNESELTRISDRAFEIRHNGEYSELVGSEVGKRKRLTFD